MRRNLNNAFLKTSLINQETKRNIELHAFYYLLTQTLSIRRGPLRTDLINNIEKQLKAK